jgi:hypothetical protein
LVDETDDDLPPPIRPSDAFDLHQLDLDRHQSEIGADICLMKWINTEKKNPEPAPKYANDFLDGNDWDGLRSCPSPVTKATMRTEVIFTINYLSTLLKRSVVNVCTLGSF